MSRTGEKYVKFGVLYTQLEFYYYVLFSIRLKRSHYNREEQNVLFDRPRKWDDIFQHLKKGERWFIRIPTVVE